MNIEPTSHCLPRLATIERAAEIFADAGETPSAIRANVFKADDRYNSRGEKIAGNGLAATGAIIRRGRKVLIDIDRYGAWLSGHKDSLENTNAPGLGARANCSTFELAGSGQEGAGQ